MRIYDARFKYTPSTSTNIVSTWKRFGFKPTTFVVNDPIQACIRSNTLALARPDGKEYKAHVVRALRVPQAESK